MMDNNAIRKEAARVLSDPDFQHYHQSEKMFDFWKWLKQFFHFNMPFDAQMSPGVWQVVFWFLKATVIILLFFALGHLAYWIFKKLKPRKKGEAYLQVTAEKRQEAQEMYLKQSAEALQNQDYRLAMHFLFLTAVSQVIRDSHFYGAEFMTNREMATATDFSRFSQAPQLSQLFNEMVYFDEPRWFGTAKVPEQDYQSFKNFYTQFAENLSGNGMKRPYA